MDDQRRTIEGATMTAEGSIPHKVTSWGLLPVKLDVETQSVKAAYAYQRPMRFDGQLVYALPGGESAL